MENPLAVANYFIKKSFDTGEELTPMKLIKLVYIAHGWHLGIFDQPLINEAVQAWKYGPVVESVYKEFRHFYNKPITRLGETFTDDLQTVTPLVNESKNQLLDRVWDVYGKFNGLQLSTLTHQKDTPWDITWNVKDGKNQHAAIIPNQLILEHYKSKMNASQQAGATPAAN